MPSNEPVLDHGHRSWTVIIPVKKFSLAKTRLAGLSTDHRRDLALAFVLDTVAAAVDTPHVRRVVIVTNDPAARACIDLGAELLDDRPDAGLNPALVHATHAVRADEPAASVAALAGDLPALTSTDLSRVFADARTPYWFVGDAAGTGTTLLAAADGHRLNPSFGPHSRAAHQEAGAVDLTRDSLARLRRDVDTVVDLADAVRLGVGRHTRAVLADAGAGGMSQPTPLA